MGSFDQAILHILHICSTMHTCKLTASSPVPVDCSSLMAPLLVSLSFSFSDWYCIVCNRDCKPDELIWLSGETEIERQRERKYVCDKQ